MSGSDVSVGVESFLWILIMKTNHLHSPDGPQLGVLLLDPPLRHHLPLRLALLAERARLPEAAQQSDQRRD